MDEFTEVVVLTRTYTAADIKEETDIELTEGGFIDAILWCHQHCKSPTRFSLTDTRRDTYQHKQASFKFADPKEATAFKLIYGGA